MDFKFEGPCGFSFVKEYLFIAHQLPLTCVNVTTSICNATSTIAFKKPSSPKECVHINHEHQWFEK